MSPLQGLNFQKPLLPNLMFLSSVVSDRCLIVSFSIHIYCTYRLDATFVARVFMQVLRSWNSTSGDRYCLYIKYLRSWALRGRWTIDIKLPAVVPLHRRFLSTLHWFSQCKYRCCCCCNITCRVHLRITPQSPYTRLINTSSRCCGGGDAFPSTNVIWTSRIAPSHSVRSCLCTAVANTSLKWRISVVQRNSYH